MKKLNSPWLLAAGTAICVAVAEAAVMIRMVPGTTVVDTGALLITGFLAGVFAGFHITGRQVGS